MRSIVKKKLVAEVFVIGLVLMFALFLRLVNLPNVLVYTFDQGRDMLAAQSIAQGDIRLLGPVTGGLGGLYLGPFYFYFLVPGFILSGGSPVGTTIWLSIIYTLTLPLAYAILRPLVSKRLALLGLFLLVLSPGSIREARVLWNPSLAVPTLLVSWFFLLKSKNHPILLVPALFAYGLMLQTELAYGILLGPVYLWWIFVHSPLRKLIPTFFASSSQTLYSWLTIMLSFAAAATTLLPQVVFELKNNFLMTKSFISYMAQGQESLSTLDLWQLRPQQLADSLYTYVFGFVPGHQFFLIALVLAMAFFACKLKKLSEKALLFFAISPLALSMFYGGGNGQFFDYYLSAHYLPISLLLPIGLARLQHTISFRIGVGAVVVISIFAFISSAPANYNDYLYDYSYKHQLAAYQKARQLAGEQLTIEVFVPNLKPVQYQYLNDWYAQTNNVSPLYLNNNVTGATTTALLYEPAFAGGSLVAFEDWYGRSTKDKNCTDKQQFGIITVEKCTAL
jgi:4-amino-4-deoxy-L-arabinose transferase-like glycosyltransferase